MATFEKVHVSQVKVGMVIAKCDIKGVPFPEYGRPLSSLKYIEELKKYGVVEVYVLASEKTERKDYGYFSTITSSHGEGLNPESEKDAGKKKEEEPSAFEEMYPKAKYIPKDNLGAPIVDVEQTSTEDMYPKAKFIQDDSNIVFSIEEEKRAKAEQERKENGPQFNSANMNRILKHHNSSESNFKHSESIDLDALLVAEEMLIDMQGEAKRALSGFFDNLSLLNTGSVLSIASDVVTMNNSDPGIFSRILSREGASQDDSHHAMSVCMHSVMLAQAVGIKGQELADISMAALLHDIGMVKVQPQILNKRTRLNEYEFAVLSKHPDYAEAILTKYPHVNENVRKIISQHHECIDGSGYPSRLSGPYISRAAQIVGIAETYNSMLEFSHEYPTATSNTDAIRRIYKESGKKYSQDLVRTFINIMGVFPVGMGLALSNKHIGVVAEVNNIEQGRPKILMLDPQNAKNVVFIDLKKHPQIRIVREIPSSMMHIHPMQIFEDFMHHKLKTIFVDEQ